MAYFFGFFGISFLDTNAMERSPSSFGLSHLDDQLYTSRSSQHQAAGFADSTSKGGTRHDNRFHFTGYEDSCEFGVSSRLHIVDCTGLGCQ